MKQITDYLFSVILICLSAMSNKAMAAVYSEAISDVYDSCSVVNLGDEYEVSLNVKFKSAKGLVGRGDFVSRAVAIYKHQSFGVMGIRVNSLTMNGHAANDDRNISYGVYYYSLSKNKNSWGNDAYFTANIVARIKNDPGETVHGFMVSVANVGSAEILVEKRGYIYINESSNGKCEIRPNVGLAQPPPRPPSQPLPSEGINITVTAPDWHLGEIKPGQRAIPFSDSTARLCLKYTGSSVVGERFIINATNQHGVKNNLYRMRHLYNPSQEVPYILMLDSTMGDSVSLPNAYNSTITLNTGGSTCFIPTFITMAPENLETGLYTDVLTFNIVTKS